MEGSAFSRLTGAPALSRSALTCAGPPRLPANKSLELTALNMAKMSRVVVCCAGVTLVQVVWAAAHLKRSATICPALQQYAMLRMHEIYGVCVMNFLKRGLFVLILLAILTNGAS